MKIGVRTIVFSAMLLALPLTPAVAQGTMKECAAEWQKLKAANQTGGKTYREFSKECMSGSKSSAAPAAPPTTAAKPEPTTKQESTTTAKPAPTTTTSKPASTTTAAKPSSGHDAEVARERSCAADWKADKAANKIPAGQRWPQYWSECDKRKKAAGM